MYACALAGTDGPSAAQRSAALHSTARRPTWGEGVEGCIYQRLRVRSSPGACHNDLARVAQCEEVQGAGHLGERNRHLRQALPKGGGAAGGTLPPPRSLLQAGE